MLCMVRVYLMAAGDGVDNRRAKSEAPRYSALMNKEHPKLQILP
jgi:hypothetical protein